MIEVSIDGQMIKKESKKFSVHLFNEEVRLPIHSKKTNYFNILFSNYIFLKLKPDISIFDEDEEADFIHIPSINRSKNKTLLQVVRIPPNDGSVLDFYKVFFQRIGKKDELYKCMFLN